MLSPRPVLLDDNLFDAHLPAYVRSRSRRFWTPVAVAARVAAAFRAQGVRTILDVGCGPGKFCIVAARLYPELDIHGIEQRPRLATLGAQLARVFGAANARFDAGDATRVAWSAYDGLYFFNPFAENVFADRDRFDSGANLSKKRFGLELLRVETVLARARAGTVIVTYHGLGGPIPASYELVADEPAGSNRIRTWVQRSRRPARWAWLEEGNGVVRVLQSDIRRVLLSLVAPEDAGARREKPPDTEG